MKYKKIYKYVSEKQLSLTNEQNNTLIIEPGDLLQFNPNFSIKNKNNEESKEYQFFNESNE